MQGINESFMDSLYLERMKCNELYSLFVVGMCNVGKMTYIKEMFPGIVIHKISDGISVGKAGIIEDYKEIIVYVWIIDVLSFDGIVKEEMDEFIDDVCGGVLENCQINRICKVVMADLSNEKTYQFIDNKEVWSDAIYLFNKNDCVDVV